MAAQCLAGAFASLSLRPTGSAQGRVAACGLRCASLAVRHSGAMTGKVLQLSSTAPQVGRAEVVAVECKLKTRKAAAKRYKITGSGKVLTRRPGKQHINEKKSPKRLRALGKEKEIDHGDKRKVVRCLPYADIA